MQADQHMIVCSQLKYVQLKYVRVIYLEVMVYGSCLFNIDFNIYLLIAPASTKSEFTDKAAIIQSCEGSK